MTIVTDCIEYVADLSLLRTENQIDMGSGRFASLQVQFDKLFFSVRL